MLTLHQLLLFDFILLWIIACIISRSHYALTHVYQLFYSLFYLSLSFITSHILYSFIHLLFILPLHRALIILSSVLTHEYFLFPFLTNAHIYIYSHSNFGIITLCSNLLHGHGRHVEFVISALGLHCLTILISWAVMLSLVFGLWPILIPTFCNQDACLFPYHVYSFSLHNLLPTIIMKMACLLSQAIISYPCL